MTEKQQKKIELKCPVPKAYRDTIKEVADIVDKHRQICKKLSL